jgi:hypothetical protein
VPIDTTRPGSPGWWLERMLKRLEQNQERYELLEEYFEGCPPVPQLRTKAVKEAYRRLMSLARTNFAELVVEAVGDAEAWRIWQASGLDAASAIVHRTQLALGDAYVMVGGVDPDLEAPIITPEDPREIAVLTDPTRPRKPIAALKAFQDELTGLDRVYLFVQGFVLRASRARGLDEKTFGYDVAGFEWSDTPQRLPGGVIPVVRFANQPDMRGNSKGEFERHLPILNRINYSILSRLEIATLQAFRQRAIKGVPWRTIMSSILQFTPQEIDRMEAERAADALLVQTLSPPAPAAQPPAQQPPPPSNGAPAG